MAMLDPVTDIVMQVLEKIAEQVDEETLRTQGSVRKKMMQIQLMYDNGEVTQNEYEQYIIYLRKRLEELKKEEP